MTDGQSHVGIIDSLLHGKRYKEEIGATCHTFTTVNILCIDTDLKVLSDSVNFILIFVVFFYTTLDSDHHNTEEKTSRYLM